MSGFNITNAYSSHVCNIDINIHNLKEASWLLDGVQFFRSDIIIEGECKGENLLALL